MPKETQIIIYLLNIQNKTTTVNCHKDTINLAKRIVGEVHLLSWKQKMKGLSDQNIPTKRELSIIGNVILKMLHLLLPWDSDSETCLHLYWQIQMDTPAESRRMSCPHTPPRMNKSLMSILA